VASVSSPIIVGRDEELARIERALNDAASGRPQILFVSGEAGIGKSRLVREAIDRGRALGSLILHGSCLDIGQGWLPYLPVVEALRGLARDLTPEHLDYVLGAGRADLAKLLPALAAEEVGASPPAEANEPSLGERARLFERFIGLLGRMGETAPTLAVLEDVHWIDPATRDLLTFLVHNLTVEPVVAVMTVRTDELGKGHPVLAWLAELSRAPGAVRIDLPRLDRSAVTRQLEAIAGTTVDDAIMRRVWMRSEGNPLFAEELLSAELNVVVPARPPSLVDVLMARIGRLSPDGQVVLEALAVAGRPADERLLAPAVEQDVLIVGGHLREAAAQGIAIALPDGRYRFRHELLREVIEQELPAAQRRHLHARFAQELEGHRELAEPNPAGADGELAHHWAEADRPVEAYRSALAAAQAAEAVNAVDQAFGLLRSAIALEARLPDDQAPTRAQQIETRRRAADAADLAREFQEAIELLRDALALVEVSADPSTAGLIHARLGYLRWATGDGAASLEEHQEAVRLVPANPPSRARARVLAGLAGGLMSLGRWDESKAIAAQAIETAHEIDADAEESRSRTFLGSDLVALGEIESGLSELRKAHELALGVGPPDLVIATGYNLGLNLLLAGDGLDEAHRLATRMWELAREAGMERRFGMDLAALAGDALTRLGRWDEADTVTHDGLALAQRRRGGPYLAAVRARLAALRGGAGEAERRLSDIGDLSDEPDTAAFVAGVRSEAGLARDDPEDVVTLAAAGLESLGASSVTGNALWAAPLVALGLRALADLAETARASSDVKRMADLRKRVEPFATRLAGLGNAGLGGGGRAWIETAAAELARFEGKARPDAWGAATETWTSVPDPYLSAYAGYRAAEAGLRAEGIKADVGDGLRTAHRTAESLQAEPLRRAIEQLAGRARIDLAAGVAREAGPVAVEAASARAAPAHRLSVREVEVLRLVAAGRTNGEIAEELFITRKTAGVHVTHILDKLGVSNRVEAAMAAARLGILSAGEDLPA
jgi:DNA-binding CsgD family transcriptional regulator/tetratricopeptide (TPR) repeat protein